MQLKDLKTGEYYRNLKTGNTYLVLAATAASSERPIEGPSDYVVVYIRERGGDDQIWYRPLDLFLEKFEPA